MESGAHVDAELPLDIGRIRLTSAELVRLLHIGIVVFTGIGWAFSSVQVLWVHLILVPLMKLHWLTNGGICFLTSVEHRLRGNPTAGTVEQPGFIYQFVCMLVDDPPQEEKVTIWMEGAMWAGWLVTILKLFVL
jgi:hypothetical protein